ncbi:uncharacterized protein CDAR_538721 [Caerostris darwini]|uniref:Uncharacterized protein n=1 Tax=Caerostris darwini TaxID=1538125 RepID=A0AAV4SYD9_9ARAC|nr:uncharacterized protein CDAR_538721 [Caerostris darwini]
MCSWRKRRGIDFWGNQKKSLTVSDPPLALSVNPLKVTDWFLGGFHAPVAPQGSLERSPHPADAHVCRTCNAFLTLPHNSNLKTGGSGAASSSSIRSRVRERSPECHRDRYASRAQMPFSSWWGDHPQKLPLLVPTKKKKGARIANREDGPSRGDHLLIGHRPRNILPQICLARQRRSVIGSCGIFLYATWD